MAKTVDRKQTAKPKIIKLGQLNVEVRSLNNGQLLEDLFNTRAVLRGGMAMLEAHYREGRADTIDVSRVLEQADKVLDALGDKIDSEAANG